MHLACAFKAYSARWISTHLSTGKGRAMRYMQQQRCFEDGCTMAVGDANNDMLMLQEMQHAHFQVVDFFKQITKYNTQITIHKFVQAACSCSVKRQDAAARVCIKCCDLSATLTGRHPPSESGNERIKVI